MYYFSSFDIYIFKAAFFLRMQQGTSVQSSSNVSKLWLIAPKNQLIWSIICGMDIFKKILYNKRVMSDNIGLAAQTINSHWIRFKDAFQLNDNADEMVSSSKSLSAALMDVNIDQNLPLDMQFYLSLSKIIKVALSFPEHNQHIAVPLREEIQVILKQILLKISILLSEMYLNYRMMGTADIIKEFLASESIWLMCRPSSPHYHQIYAKERQKYKDQGQQQYVWARKASFTTYFHRQIIEQIMRRLCKFTQKFGDTRLPVLAQYYKLIYYLDDYIIEDKLIALLEEQLTHLENDFKSPSKEHMKDASKQSLDAIAEHFIKVLRLTKKESLKVRLQLLGPFFGISLMNSPSIEKKMVGAKIVNKFAYEMTYRNNHYLSELNFGQKLIQWRYFQLVFEQNYQESIVKCSDDGIKLLIRKELFSEQKFIKLFNQIQKSSLEFRRVLYRLIDPYRIHYRQIQIMIKLFKELKDISLYDQEFFPFFQGLARYSTHTQLKQQIAIVEMILNEFYPKFKDYLLKRRAIDCYNYIFDKLIYQKKSTEERVEEYLRVIDSFLAQPCEFKLITLKNIMDGINDSKLDPYKVIELTKIIVEDKHFVSKSFELMALKIHYQSDLIYFLKTLLKKYRSFHEQLSLNKQIYAESVDYPQIFEELLALKEPKDCQKLMEELSNLLAVKEVPFSCIRSTFYRLNLPFLKPIKKEYTDIIASYITNAHPNQLQGLDYLKYLLYHSKYHQIRRGCAELISQLAVFYSDQMRDEGESITIEFMKNMVKLIKLQYQRYKGNDNAQEKQNNEQINANSQQTDVSTQKTEKSNAINGNQDFVDKQSLILGVLTMIEQLMLTSQYFGVGHLRAHNSLIPTSMTRLKIYNNATHGDDVLKIYEKNIPSNWTLFEVIVEVSKQFKVGPLDVALEYPNDAILKYNGLTLQELKLNNHELNILKLSHSRTKKAEILKNNEPTPLALAAFKKIFHKFAVNGFMGKKQCANYIEGATQHFCTSYDHRISALFVQYDSDHDDQLTEENFVKFYTECLFDEEKFEAVEKNFMNLRFRRDLKQYDEPFDNLNEETLFRYHITQDNTIYQMLFELTQSENQQIRESAERVLVRLPTYKKIADELNCKITFEGKNSFQIQYFLTAIQGMLNSSTTNLKKKEEINGKLPEIIQVQEQPKSKFISLQNHLIINDLLNKLYHKENKNASEKECLIVCLHILRSLVEIPHLKQIDPSINVNVISLPSTDIFYQLVSQALQNNDLTIYEPSLILQLTQDTLPSEWIESAIFHKDRDIRNLTCNFLYYWQLKSKFALNLYTLPSKLENCQQMFRLLNLLIIIDTNVDIHQLFAIKLKELSNQRESLQGLRFNPMINGNLKLMKHLISRITPQQQNQLNALLTELTESVISNQNRKLVFYLKKYLNEDSLIDYLIQLSDTQPTRQVQLKNNYVGIKNLGSICYLNSILQQFYMIKSFKMLILKQQNQFPIEEKLKEYNEIKFVDDFLYQLQRMYCHLQFIQKKYYNPKQFCLTLKDHTGKPINTGIQEDAHQFLNTAFDKIEGYLKTTKTVCDLENIFGGKTVTVIICLKCKNKIEKLEHFYHLSVQVKDKSSLVESLNKFIEIQEISDYFCEICQSKVEKISKQVFIHNTPQVLIINLQRITFDLETLLKVKVHSRLQFPFTIDLANYIQNDQEKQCNYRLKGVVIHSGTSESGHYYSLIRQGDEWFKFNDEAVSVFNLNEMGREAYGGNEDNDQWGEYISSTNAYILFYQKIYEGSPNGIDKEIKDIEQSNPFVQQALLSNKLLYKQLQISQQSYFQIISELLAPSIPTDMNQSLLKEPFYPTGKLTANLDKLIKLLAIHIKIMKVLSIYYEIPSSLIKQIKENIIILLHLLPDQTTKLIEGLQSQEMVNVILTHNEPAVRQLYQQVMNKAIKIYEATHSEDHKGIDMILTEFALPLKNDAIFKDPFKTYQYFDFWRQIPKYSAELFEMGTFLDILMGNESPFANKEKKRQEFHYSQSKPITDIILKMLKSKASQNSADHNKEPLSQKQTKILSNVNFYKKLILNKHEQLCAKLIEFQSNNDLSFSKKIAQFLLKGLNSNELFEEKEPIMLILLYFLTIKDAYQQKRFEWMLGIPQLCYIGDKEFGLMTSGQSTVYNYVSGLQFVAEQTYMPLLQFSHEKSKYSSLLSMQLNTMLLELMTRSDEALTYVLSLPAPVYQSCTYFDFMGEYITNLKAEESYYLKEKKQYYIAQLEKLHQLYKTKEAAHPLFQELPVNQYIVGKNAELQKLCEQSSEQPKYSLEIYAHYTYTLLNLPNGKENASMPTKLFAFGSSIRIIDYYIKRDYEMQPNDQLAVELTMVTVHISDCKRLIIRIQLPNFNHQIQIQGEIYINFPYPTGIPKEQIRKYIEVESMDEQEIKIQITQLKDKKHSSDEFEKEQVDLAGYSLQGEYFYEISCPTCTYINVGREKCEVCENYLYK